MPNASVIDYDAPFPSRLRTLMHDTTQKELAEYIGVSRQSISQYMDGSSQPVASKVAQIADYFKVSTDYLLGRTAAKQPENINAVEKYGLSEAALSVLEEIRAYKRNDFVLRAVNALLENRVTLGAIAQYLYFNLSEDHQEKGMVPYVTVYKYGKKGDNSIWGDDVKQLGLYSTVEVMTNETYKRTLMLKVQETLQKMLEQENETV